MLKDKLLGQDDMDPVMAAARIIADSKSDTDWTGKAIICCEDHNRSGVFAIYSGGVLELICHDCDRVPARFLIAKVGLEESPGCQ